jgi:hypothetical protein
MNLYIETENGTAKNHPAFEDNLVQAFGVIPEHWEPFVRVERPALGMYDVLDSDEPVYQKVDGTWTDVWMVRSMTVEEKAAKQQAVRDAFNNRPQAENWSAWVLDEEKLIMAPPIPRPAPDQTKLDAKIYTYWCGAEGGWKDTPPRPDGEYKFDFFTWEWVAI